MENPEKVKRKMEKRIKKARKERKFEKTETFSYFLPNFPGNVPSGKFLAHILLGSGENC